MLSNTGCQPTHPIPWTTTAHIRGHTARHPQYHHHVEHRGLHRCRHQVAAAHQAHRLTPKVSQTCTNLTKSFAHTESSRMTEACWCTSKLQSNTQQKLRCRGYKATKRSQQRRPGSAHLVAISSRVFSTVPAQEGLLTRLGSRLSFVPWMMHGSDACTTTNLNGIESSASLDDCLHIERRMCMAFNV